MTLEVVLGKIGNSRGVIVPTCMLAELAIRVGDKLAELLARCD